MTRMNRKAPTTSATAGVASLLSHAVQVPDEPGLKSRAKLGQLLPTLPAAHGPSLRQEKIEHTRAQDSGLIVARRALHDPVALKVFPDNPSNCRMMNFPQSVQPHGNCFSLRTLSVTDVLARSKVVSSTCHWMHSPFQCPVLKLPKSTGQEMMSKWQV